MAVLMLLLTALAMLAIGYAGAELVRSTCRRWLVTPVRVRAVDARPPAE